MRLELNPRKKTGLSATDSKDRSFYALRMTGKNASCFLLRAWRYGRSFTAVCVELDQSRYQALVAGDQWQQMDIFKVIRERKAAQLLGLFFEMLQMIVMTEIQSLIALLFFCFGI
ncbi:TraB determinant protein [Caldalkalibacillus thermarum TA2.A1]|uniref:TraB determinant protein n=1 Tax=Caldalkalibacillus thermarum (strain TA2.A1) TaxID=986075 RepID=F5L981_CALTT|nr:hypothetical protein [Caldalkalibacillus thermarum]EGL82103.1 TraB determinant protein [Caldalkalibacillus thermarum TA2.A1]QZT34934.1 hypothetical protein HUR95_06735 [Caldalkalibacillus thermarum TA2.A1]